MGFPKDFVNVEKGRYFSKGIEEKVGLISLHPAKKLYSLGYIDEFPGSLTRTANSTDLSLAVIKPFLLRQFASGEELSARRKS